MRAVVVGAGIAGLSLVLRLHRAGWDSIVLERAPRLRGEGYMLDFWGLGFDASERMGLLPLLEAIHHPISALVFVDGRGRRRLAVRYETLHRRLFKDRHFNFLRGDLEAVLYQEIAEAAHIRFGTTVRTLVQDGPRIEVGLSDGTVESADLVVGADGVHSQIRALVCGPDERFLLTLGQLSAAWILDHVPALVDPDAFTTLTVPGRMVAIYPIRGHRAATFLAHRTSSGVTDLGEDARMTLRRIYGDLGWVVPEVLDSLNGVGSIYLDDVAQVRLDRWSRGRVVLLGDAAWCVSLLAGEGASLALAGADLLGTELERHRGNVVGALGAWEQQLRPVVAAIQAAGRRTADWFVPADRLHLWARDLFMRLSTWPIASALTRRHLGIDRTTA